MSESIGKAYKPWLVLSLAAFLVSLMLLAVVGSMAFVRTGPSPLWLLVLGVVAALGMALGFAGFFLIMLTAGWHSFRESRRVQVIPPEHSTK